MGTGRTRSTRRGNGQPCSCPRCIALHEELSVHSSIMSGVLVAAALRGNGITIATCFRPFLCILTAHQNDWKSDMPSSNGNGIAVRQRSSVAQPGRTRTSETHRGPNVGRNERQVSLAAGIAAVAVGLSRRSLLGALTAGVGAGLIYRGASGHCNVYQALGLDSLTEGDAEDSPQMVEFVRSFLIDRPIEELYSKWRQLDGLPSIMSHLERVEVIDDRHSHWVAGAPTIAGGSVEWVAELVEDVPNERIAWRSLAGADVDSEGSVEFKKAPGERGTILRVSLNYAPPAGQLGKWFAKILGQDPESQIQEDLRRFKRVMEIGEAITTDGQPRGGGVGGVGRLFH